MSSEFLSLDQFPDAAWIVKSVFHTEKRLPEQVFKRSYQFYLLHEYESAMGAFMSILRKIGSPLARERVLLSVLDPDPITYFYKHFRAINAFYFNADIPEKEFYTLRERNPSHQWNAPPFQSEVETYIPSSGTWAMWGDRSREIAVLGLDDLALASYLVKEHGYWVDAEAALEGFARVPYKDQIVPEDLRREFITNFGNSANLEQKLAQEVKFHV